LGNLVPKIMGWLVVIIALALAPTINTTNGYISSNVTAAVHGASMIGMSTVVAFGAPIMIISILFSGALIVMGKIGDGSTKSLMGVIGTVIVVIIALSMFVSIIGYVDTLITASTGFAQTIYGVIPIILYVGIIAGAGGVSAYQALRKGKGKKKSTSVSSGF
jgi:hypothetical protein